MRTKTLALMCIALIGTGVASAKYSGGTGGLKDDQCEHKGGREVLQSTIIVSGHVRTSLGNPIEGVSMTAQTFFGPTYTDSTDHNGYYEFQLQSPWTGSINAAKQGWVMSMGWFLKDAVENKTIDFLGFYTYGGGFGSESNPLRIETAEHLDEMSEYADTWSMCFKVVNDINLSGYIFSVDDRIGTNTIPFTGVFDGNGQTISNLSYQNFGPEAYNGLFAVVGDGTPGSEIKNLRLVNPEVIGTGWGVGGLVGVLGEWSVIENCHIEGGRVDGGLKVGGLAGVVQGVADVSNCSSSAYVLGDSSVGGLVGDNRGFVMNSSCSGSVNGDYYYVGGLVGDNSNGSIERSYAINCVSGLDYVGGLTGVNRGVVHKCYSKSSVLGVDYVGGLTGYCTGDLLRSYAAADVHGNQYVGGLIGMFAGEVGEVVYRCYSASSVEGNSDKGVFTGKYTGGSHDGCFWDNMINGSMNGIGNMCSSGVMGRTTGQMHQMITFADAGWDFVEVWDIGEGQTYPFLRVYPAADLNHSGLVDWHDFAILAGHWLQEGG